MLDNSITYSIQALSEKGKVRVLSAPELVVKCPGQAELFAGGELPIHLKNHYEDKVVWKNIGLSLKLDVKEYNGEKVRLSIETELNHISTEWKIDQIPGVKTNRIKTQVEGTMGKPLLLSGLLEEELRGHTSGLPGLSDIPVLGKLFGSEDYQNNRSELVAILIPYREPPREPMQRISSDIPKGYLPLSRNFLSQEQIETLQASREYPWNVL
jgi:pilus assembly protein CpaC